MDDPKSIDELIYDRRVPHSPAPLLPCSLILPVSAPSCGSHRYQCQQVSRRVRIASLRQRPRILISSFCVQRVHPLLGHALSRGMGRGGQGAGWVNHCYLDPLVAPCATLMLLLVFRIAIMLTIRVESSLGDYSDASFALGPNH